MSWIRHTFHLASSSLSSCGAIPSPCTSFTLLVRKLPSLSVFVSTCAATRARLQRHVWPTIACIIKVVLHFRDPGAHICTGNRMVTPTWRDRLVAGHGICQRLSSTGLDYEARHRAIRTLVLPLSLLGCEASPFPAVEIGKLVTAVARNIGPYSHLSSNTMAFLTASACNLDPIEEVLYRRIAMLRRMLAKHPKLMPLVATIYDVY